jgi:Tfp pilus assembly major pilin PilA/nucleoid DNA-binding protein
MKVDVLANLETLLHHHEKVNIPGIGTINTRQNDFSIDRRQGLIIPASKHVHQLTQITNPDNETLIHFIAYKHGISLEESRQIVRTFALQYHDIIRHQGLNIPGIGKIFMDETGKIFFEPNSVYNYDVEHFGLPVLNMHPITMPKDEVKEKVVKENPQPKSANKAKPKVKAEIAPRQDLSPGRLNPYLNILRDNLQLQAMILVSILLILTIPIVQNYVSKNSNPTPPTTAEIITPPINNTIEESEPPTPRNVEPVIEKPTPQPKVEEVQPTTPVEVTDPNKHIAVVGVFSTKDNAQRYQVEVFEKGFEAILMENGSKFRVGVVLKCSKSELPSKLKELRAAYPKAWLK